MTLGPRHGWYRKTARIWSLVFLAVGLCFLFAPEPTSRSLTGLARLLGLPGTLSFPAGNLGYILSLSLMGTIAFLADASAESPTNRSLYLSLMTAKLLSTAGFFWLAFREEPAWLVAAVGDGFVALTLWASRRYYVEETVPSGFLRRYRGQSPFYEVWFGKVDIAPGQALWFRYSLLSGLTREAAVWAVLFEGDKVTTGKETAELAPLAPGPVFRWGNNHLDSATAVGRAGNIRWDLRWTDSGRRCRHGPSWLTRVGLAKSSYDTSFLDLRVSGTIQSLTVRSVPGMIGHISGRKQAESWVWVHCNQFEGTDDIVFEGLSVQIRLGGQPVPFASFVLHVKGYRYLFSTFTSYPESGEGGWNFAVERRGVRLEGEVLRPKRIAVITYTDTDGSPLWCRNSKLSSLRLRLIDPGRKVDLTLESRSTAAFEWVNRKPPAEPVDL